MSELVLIKLVTSEEIIAKVLEEDDEKYKVEKPRLCAMQQGQGEDGKVGNFLVLLPWIMYAFDPTTKTERDSYIYKNTIAGQAVDVPKINDFPVIESAVTVIVIALVALVVTVFLRRKN